LQEVRRLENSGRPNRQTRMAFEFKEEFDRSRKSSLSATIIIDRFAFLGSTDSAVRAIAVRLPTGLRQASPAT
jgi:hypothetical protein